MERVYNFSAGPAVIDQSVLEKAASELVCYQNKGMSVMEMSHRTSMFMDIYNEAIALVREVLSVPDEYAVLFLQGGATLQFAGVPVNLMTGSNTADYIDTGNFAHLALKEAKKYGKVNVAASSLEDNYTFIPDMKTSSSLLVQIMFTLPPITPSTARAISSCPIQTACRWLPICRLVSRPNRWTSAASA